MMADVLIVSIDESSFKQEGIPSRYWQCDAKTLKKLFEPMAEDSVSITASMIEEFKETQVQVVAEPNPNSLPLESPKSVVKATEA